MKKYKNYSIGSSHMAIKSYYSQLSINLNLRFWKISMLVLLQFSLLLTLGAQTSLEGNLFDKTTGEPVLFGTVTLYKNDVLVTGVETDLDGNYYFKSIDPGTYDVEGSYIGYTPSKISNVIIKAGRVNKLNIGMSEGVLLDHVEIIEYKVPLLKMDNTTCGATVTAEAIRSLPKKNINAIAAVTAGISSDDGGAISIRGSRSDATVYYVDGVRVTQQLPHNGKSLNSESYEDIIENTPKSPYRAPLSTFSIDVDGASYSNVRRYLNQGTMPPKDAVRIEEMINYFDYKYDEPTKKRRPFEVTTEVLECPWTDGNKLLHIGVQGKRIKTEDLPNSNLVFLIDVSGSMDSENKLGLVKKSFYLLLETLKKGDRVAIVTYAGAAEVVLPSTSITEKATIKYAIKSLGSGGGTAGAQGIITAYDIARNNFMQDGNNRVILATDGDFNIGTSSQVELDKLIVRERKSGVFLSVLGYGMGNYKDDRMQSLANKGNGNHNYIDGIKEAEKVLVREMGATLHTIAKDVKIQIEFNPAYVGAYRLIGYENRMLKDKDFTDDTKDAGELGAGHNVTAIYEIYPPTGEAVEVDQKLYYQKGNSGMKENNEMATVKLRYKAPDGYKSWEISEKISSNTKSNDQVNDRSKHIISVAEFGLMLRDSRFAGSSSYDQILNRLKSIEDRESVEELIGLVNVAKKMSMVN